MIAIFLLSAPHTHVLCSLLFLSHINIDTTVPIREPIHIPMNRSRTPAYHSLYESTSGLLMNNVSTWKPLWAQPNSESRIKSRSNTDANVTKDSVPASSYKYNGIMTAHKVNSVVYCAIVESKTFSPTVGICLIDPHTSCMKVTEIIDSPTFVRTIHKLFVQEDVGTLELLIPSSYGKRKCNFIKILESNIPDNVHMNFISDSAFKTTEYSLNALCEKVTETERGAMRVEMNNKKYGVSAACACIHYLKELPSHSFIHEKFNVRYESPEDSMFISTSAVKDLELIASSSAEPRGKNLSLFGFLNQTVTKMGERLLKTNIVQPMTNKTSLNLRYQAVNEFIANDGVSLDVRLEMKSLVDLDNLFSYLCKKPKENIEVINQQKINFVLLLKKVLMSIVKIKDFIAPLESNLVKEAHRILSCEDVESCLARIDEYINEDCTWVNTPVELRNQKCYAIKARHNGLLDASRQLYKTLVDEIIKEIEDLSEQYNISLYNKYDKNRGFYIFIKDYSLACLEELDVSIPFINCIQRGKNVECITMNIAKLNLRIDSLLNEIFLMTEDTVDELIHTFRKSVSSFFLISEAISLLDLLSTFAFISTKPQYETFVCSELNDRNIVLKSSRHPLLEHLYTTIKKNESRTIVDNDVTIVEETSRIQIITGPNMSGKSIYIKQFALNVILTQIGMFIPAVFSTMKIFKSLFTRMSSDTLQDNMSTFSLEMVEMAFILQNADKDSLIIIDELGRGTGLKDGMAICVSMVDRIREMKSVCLFVTHFVGIPEVFQHKPGVFELHMGVSESSDVSKAKFKISAGKNLVSGYGIKIVEDKKLFTPEIVARSKELSDKLKIFRAASMISCEVQSRRNLQNRLILNFYEMLSHAVHNVTDTELFEALSNMEDHFIAKYEEINEMSGEISMGSAPPSSRHSQISTTATTNTTATVSNPHVNAAPNASKNDAEMLSMLDFRID